MLHRGPVVITTLEEDFKKIGLLKDEAKAKAEEEDDSPEAEGGKKEMPDFIKKKIAAKGEAKAKSEEEDDEDDSDEAEDDSPKAEAKKAAKTEDDDADEDDSDEAEDDEDDSDEAEESVEGEDGEEMDEARRIAKRVVKGTRGKLKRTKRTPAGLRVKAKRYYRKMKRKLKRAFAKKMRKPTMRRRAKFLRKKAAARRGEGAETIANLIEDVQSIVSTIDFNANDAMKSFANIAIISDLLANTFNEWKLGLNEAAEEQGETVEYGEYDSYVESLTDLAEAAAEVATALKNGDTVEGGVEELEAIFKEYMADMLEGMDAYNTLAEQPDTMRGAKGMHAASKGEEAEDDSDEAEDDDSAEAEEESRPSKR